MLDRRCEETGKPVENCGQICKIRANDDEHGQQATYNSPTEEEEEEKQDTGEEKETREEQAVTENQVPDADNFEKLMKNDKKLKAGMLVDYRKHDQEWKIGQVISRAGKVKGKYENHWNINDLISGEIEALEMKEEVTNWREHEDVMKHCNKTDEESHAILMVNDDLKNCRIKLVGEAKSAEINKWIEENVFEEFTDKGQEKISVTKISVIYL